MILGSKNNVYLVDSVVTKMTGNKLPSTDMAVRFFLCHHNDINFTVREALKSQL